MCAQEIHAHQVASLQNVPMQQQSERESALETEVKRLRSQLNLERMKVAKAVATATLTRGTALPAVCQAAICLLSCV